MPYLPILDILRVYFEIKEEDREFVIRKKLEEKILQLDENLKSELPTFQDLLSLRVEDAEYLKLKPKEKNIPPQSRIFPIGYEAARAMVRKEGCAVGIRLQPHALGVMRRPTRRGQVSRWKS